MLKIKISIIDTILMLLHCKFVMKFRPIIEAKIGSVFYLNTLIFDTIIY